MFYNTDRSTQTSAPAFTSDTAVAQSSNSYTLFEILQAVFIMMMVHPCASVGRAPVLTPTVSRFRSPLDASYSDGQWYRPRLAEPKKTSVHVAAKHTESSTIISNIRTVNKEHKPVFAGFRHPCGDTVATRSNAKLHQPGGNSVVRIVNNGPTYILVLPR